MSKATDEAHDDKVIELGKAFVRAYNDWGITVKKFGAVSTEANEKYRVVLTVQKRLHKLQAQDRKRAKKLLGMDSDGAFS